MFSGAGGLDLAVEQWTGATCAWTCERDPHASFALAAHGTAPNLGDITAVDWSSVEPVDVVCGGFPCQDISNAGKRAGITGARSGLWSFYADAVRHLRPRHVYVENVGALLVRGLGTVLGDLAEMGYDATWGCVRASDAGAPHRRERVFIVATDADRVARPAPVAVDRRSGEVDEPGAVERAVGLHRVADGGVKLLPTPAASAFNDSEDPQSWLARAERLKEKHGNGNGAGMPLAVAAKLLPTPTARDGKDVGNLSTVPENSLLPRVVWNQWGDPKLLPTPTVQQGRNATYADRWGDYAPAIERWEHVLGRPAPAPVDEKGRLSPIFVEWMMGWPNGWVTHLDHLGVKRTAQLRLLGNGVVPQQALLAFAALEHLAVTS
jgi:DNA (cytosine-5)-methyltransferase 1